MIFASYNDFIPFGIVSAILAFAIAAFCFGYKHLRETTSLALMMISVGIWSLSGAMELSALTAVQKVFWSKISYLGISTIGPTYFVFSLYYSSLNKYISKKLVWILGLFSLFILILALTNDYHGLIWTKTTPLVNQYGMVVVNSHGLLLKILTFIIYFLLLVSTFLIFRSTYIKKNSYPISTSLIFIAIILPWIANFYYMFGKSIAPGFDITPIVFSISGLLFFIGILLFRTLNVMPFANKLLFDSMKGAVVITNKDQRISSSNKSMNELLNIENPVGFHLENILPELSEYLPENNTTITTEILFKEAFFELQITPVSIKKGNIEGFIIILRNINEKIKHEKELLRIQNKLKNLNDNQNKILSIISHDFRGSLRNFIVFLDLILNDPSITEDESRGILSALLKDSNINLQLLDNLLNWARMQNDKIVAKTVKLNLSELIDQAISRNLTSSQNKNVEILSTVPVTLSVSADNSLFSTILHNLISNAIKFSFEKTIVTISAEIKGDFVYVNVTDQGVGIPVSRIESIFEINQTVSSLGTKGEKGSGFGLFLCKEFIELMGGEIKVISKAGKGSNFIISIPLAAE